MAGVIDYSLIDRSVFDTAVSAFLPGTAYVAFSQDGGIPLAACVSPGDRVSEGTVIARSADWNNVIHSPIPGTVESLCVCQTPNGRKTPAAKIKLSGVFSYTGKLHGKNNWDFARKAKLAEKGVINTFLTPEPLASQIEAAGSGAGRKQRAFIAAALFDSDPSQKTDAFIAKKYAAEVAEGAAILASIINAKGIVFAADKKILLQEFFSVYRTFIYPCDADFIGITAAQYPAGTKFGIMEALRLARLKTLGYAGPPVSAPVLFVSASTLRDVYRALVLDMPVMETHIHVTGAVIKTPGMFSVRVGTLIQDIVEECGGFTKEPSLIVINGKALGMSIDKLDVPVTKYVKSIRFLHKSELPDQKAGECVRCGHCKNVCPSRLEPGALFAHAAGIKSADEETAVSSVLCVNCALCNAACPASLPLS